MEITSIIAIYALFWVMTAFVVLPIGIRSHHETGAKMVDGQADGAPANFQPKKLLLRTTVVSGIAFGLFYANYVFGWLALTDINIFGKFEG